MTFTVPENRRTAYRFSHRSEDGKTYYWWSKRPLPGDSRSELIICNVDWFWAGGRS